LKESTGFPEVSPVHVPTIKLAQKPAYFLEKMKFPVRIPFPAMKYEDFSTKILRNQKVSYICNRSVT
jgi:hypothetical protein